MMRLDTACRAIVGARSRQEDNAALWPGDATFELGADWPQPQDGALLGVLADGMGGHVSGHVASETVCELFVRAFADASGDAREKLQRGLATANAGISKIVGENPALAGMGSTAVGFVIAEDALQWVSVGDSPMYLVRNGEIAMLNEDHSLAPALDQLVAEGKMSEAAAKLDPRRHMLRSAVTGDELDLIDVSDKPLPLVAGDIIVAASDGVLTLEPDDIGRFVAGYADAPAAQIAEALIREVENQRAPGQDNTTVIIVKISA